MKRSEVLKILANNKTQLRNMGVQSLEIFGSVAREEANDISDVDLLVEFDHPVGFFHLVSVEEYIENLLKVKIDLVVRRALRNEFKEDVYKEAVRAI